MANLEGYTYIYGHFQIVDVVEELCRTKKTDDITMREYISQVIRLARDVNAAMGDNAEPFGDSMIAAFVLRGLKHIPKYQVLLKSQFSKVEDLTTKNVKAVLLFEERQDRLDARKKKRQQRSNPVSEEIIGSKKKDHREGQAQITRKKLTVKTKGLFAMHVINLGILQEIVQNLKKRKKEKTNQTRKTRKVRRNSTGRKLSMKMKVLVMKVQKRINSKKCKDQGKV